MLNSSNIYLITIININSHKRFYKQKKEFLFRMQVSHPRHYRFTISVSKSSSFSFLPNRYSCKNSVMCILNCKRLDSLYYAPIKSRNGTFDSPQSIATPSAFVAFVHFSNFLYVSFAESFSLTQLNSRITLEYFANKT